MKIKYVLLFLVILGLTSCKASKERFTTAQINSFNELLTSQKFVITSDWAYPQMTNALNQVLSAGFLANGSTPQAINLIGNTNFLKIKGDSVSCYLPFFGERQMQTGYGGVDDSAIQFDGLMTDYKLEDGKYSSKIISFKADSKNEKFNVIIKMFPNLKSEIILNGNTRFAIRYAGDAAPVENDPPQKS